MLLLNSGLTTFDLIYKRFIIGKFFVSPHITNPIILGLIPQSQVH
jgi:hypothetical protein